MKRRLLVWIAVLCMPLGMMAQDDIYFVPSRKAKTEKMEKTENSGKEVPAVTTTTVYTEPAETVVVVRNRDGELRDVDEYNRRYDADEYDFQMEGDTLYVEEAEEDGLDGEWVTGEFDGSASDYEYATRIIRFRNPRFAVSISSPFYWDIVYGAGMNSWDWNVYTDGMYAYAFPTFSNPLWWDWRYNSFGWGWYGPGWGGYYAGFWGGWYGWGYPGYWHPGHWHPGYYPGHSYWGHHVTYTNRTSYGPQNRTSYGSRSSSATVRRSGTSVRRGSGTSTRVVGTRSSSTRSSGTSVRSSGASVRRGGTYTRPSSTRGTAVNGSIRNSSTRGSSSTVRSSGQTYNTFDATNRNSNTGIRTSTGSSTRVNSGFSGSSRSSGGFSGGGFSGGSRSSGGSVRSSGSRR